MKIQKMEKVTHNYPFREYPMKVIRYREFASERNDIKIELISKREELILHLFKIFYHGQNNSGLLSHWCGDLYDLLYWLPTLKGSHRLPDFDLIYDTLWGDREEGFLIFSDRMIKKLNLMSKKRPRDGFGLIKGERRGCKEFCRKYFIWLSEQISEKGRVSEEEVRKKIKALLKEYNN